MKSLLLSSYNNLEIAEMPVPAVADGEVLVRVEACGICGSDVHGYDGGSGRRIPPIVMGHEAAGTVASVGSGVTGFAVGDRVTFPATAHSLSSSRCRSAFSISFQLASHSLKQPCSRLHPSPCTPCAFLKSKA